MLREAILEDASEIERFLEQTPATTMFLRSNLAHGIGWGAHKHSTRYFLWRERDGIAAIFGLTRGGFLMGQAGEVPGGCFKAFADAIAGETVVGMTGALRSVEQTLGALGLSDAAFSLHDDEPLMAMDLAGLGSGSSRLRRAEHRDQELLVDWFTQYEMDTGLSADRTSAVKSAETYAAEACKNASRVRVLMDEGGNPCAMAAINARAGDTVQVGGVYVPNALRGQGLGGRVVLALLAEAKAAGARTAFLFANNAIAERAYLAIGFAPIGRYRVALLEDRCVVGALA